MPWPPDPGRVGTAARYLPRSASSCAGGGCPAGGRPCPRRALGLLQLAALLDAVFAQGPAQSRPGILRPRPPYLPHPCRRLPRLRGVVRYSKGEGGAPPRPAGMAYGFCPHRQRTARWKLKSVGSSGVIAVVALPCSKAPKSRQTFRNQPKAGG